MSKLLAELDEILLKILDENGYSTKELMSRDLKFNNVLFHYLNLLKRQFKLEHIYEVHISKELKKKLNIDSRYKKIINKIKNKMLDKKSIVFYTSTFTEYVKYEKDKRLERDKLLYDWGIFHFHLSGNNKNDKYCKRTNDLLFVFVQNNIAYFLEILPHGNFENCKLLEVIYNNWKEKLVQHAVKGLISCDKVNTKNVRKNNSLALYQIKDMVIFPPGGGLNSYGSSIKIINNVDQIQTYFLDIEEKLIRNNIFDFKLLNKNNILFLNMNGKEQIINLEFFSNSEKLW